MCSLFSLVIFLTTCFVFFFNQLIQDEIKALVQLQNRQASVQPHTEFSAMPVTKSTAITKDYIFPLIPGDCTVLKNGSLAAPVHTPFSSPSPPLPGSETNNQAEEPGTTVLSSGYGTLSTWETRLEADVSPGDVEKDTETPETGDQQDFPSERTVGVGDPEPAVNQQKTPGYVRVLHRCEPPPVSEQNVVL